MLGADIDPAAAVTSAVVAPIEPLDAKLGALAAIMEMPNRKSLCRMRRLLQHHRGMRLRLMQCQQNQQK